MDYKFEVPVTMTLTDMDMSYILCCAFEGYSNEWMTGYRYDGVIKDPDTLPKWTQDWPKYCVLPIFGSMTILCSEGEFVLSRSSLTKGLELLVDQAPDRVVRLVDESYDAEDADCFL